MTAGVELDISELLRDFPGTRIACVIAVGLAIPAEHSAAVDAFVTKTERDLAAHLAGVDLASIPEVRVWREAYKAFGVKKTSYRSSVERLLKQVQRGGRLPRVNALVDLYNAVSALHLMPIGADDLDCITSPLAFRYARDGDTFFALGDTSMTADPPKPGEIVYADAEKCLCRRWNWYQDARSAVTTDTSGAVLTVQAMAPSPARGLETAVTQLKDLIERHCGGQVAWAIADASAPRVAAVAPC